MKIHALCIAKNEADIIEQTLISATSWCDFIYFFDNGSNDGTWEKVLKLAKEYEEIIPYKQENCPFSDSLRSQIFNHYLDNCVEDDWWCRLDADEIYIDNPAEFIAKIPSKYNVVVSAMFQYYFTDRDLLLYEQDPLLYADDVPIEKKCKYYINNWSEIRFFRYSKKLDWPLSQEWPSGLVGDAFPIRIRQKNFQYRSPSQIRKRIETRLESIARGLFPHESQLDWKKNVLDNYSAESKVDWNNICSQSWKDRIMDASNLCFDKNDGNYILNHHLMPNLYTMSLIWDYKLSVRNLFKRLFKKVDNFIRSMKVQRV
jgi:Glycosyl transferase family 2